MLQSVLYTLFHLTLTLALESKGILRKVICQRSYNQLALEPYNPGLLISKPEYPPQTPFDEDIYYHSLSGKKLATQCVQDY